MSKKTLTQIECDSCRETSIIGNDENYPYDKGWCFLYSFNAQFPMNLENTKDAHNRIYQKEKHFCSMKCMNKFLKKIISSTEKIVKHTIVKKIK